MGLNLSAPTVTELQPKIVVIGIGGAGGNAVNNMIQTGLEGVEFVVANTDAQALSSSVSDRRIQLGSSITQGLGCGAKPEVGRASAEEAIQQIMDHLTAAHMVFITAGMGGGTGTGGAPVIAEACRDAGILTVGVVTKPFHFEGSHRMKLAEQGIEELQSYVDTLIVIPNQNLFRVANEKTTFADAFSMADQVLNSGVRGITDLMVMPGLINLDFADVKTVMSEMGKAMMGTGEAEGETRAIEAAAAAISNPLLDEVSMSGARGLLINITGGLDLTLFEVDEAANQIRKEVDPEANIIVGSALDDSLNGRMRVSVVATGIDAEHAVERAPVRTPQLSVVSKPTPEAAPAPEAEAPLAMPTQAVTAEPTPLPAASLPAAPVAQPAPPPPAASAEPAFEAEQAPLFASAGGGAVAQAIPQPKPLAPEPEAMPRQVVEEAPVEDAPFIAPRPVTPSLRPTRPAPEAESAPESEAAPQAEPKRASRGMSLFRRMTGGGRADAPAETAERKPVFGQRSEPTMAEQAPAEAPAPAPAPTPTAVFENPEPAPSLAPRDDLDGLAQREEDDLLEIPSFLRRQAN